MWKKVQVVPIKIPIKMAAFDNTCCLLSRLFLDSALALCTDFRFASNFLMILRGWIISDSFGLFSNVRTVSEKIKAYIYKSIYSYCPNRNLRLNTLRW